MKLFSETVAQEAISQDTLRELGMRAIPAYDHQDFHRRLSMEASFQNNVIAFFKETLPSLTEQFKTWAAKVSFVETRPDIAAIDRDFAAAERSGAAKVWLNYRDVIVQVPEGFKGEFYPYAATLDRMGTDLYEKTNKLLTEYRFALSSILSNPEQRTSLKDLSAGYEQASAAREELAEGLAAFFGNGNSSRAKLVDVLPNFGETKEFVRAVKSLGRYADQKQLKIIQQSVKETVDVLKLIEAQVTNEDVTDISPVVVKNIANGAHVLAQYIDQVVAFHYAVISLIGVTELLMKKVKTFT